MAMRAITTLLLILSAGTLQACGSSDDGALPFTFIGEEESLFASGLRLSEGGQHVRAAMHTGLVTRDAQGEIIPALADRWIVTDDGLSYIFRLREGNWGDGNPLTAESARNALTSVIRELSGTSVELDLQPVDEVRAMASGVVEIRLSSPFPALLQLLAQPELALDRGTVSSGVMVLERNGQYGVLKLKPPEERGLPEEAGWEKYNRSIELRASDAARAVSQFEAGSADLVLGGQIGDLPLADVGPLSRGTVRIDPAIGMFGLMIQNSSGPLETAELREAISMAIDRPELISAFNIGGWTPTTRVVNPALPGDPGLIAERWEDDDLDALRARAAQRIAAWRAALETPLPEGPVGLTIALGEGPGFDVLLGELASQMATIGISLERVEEGGSPDFQLVDRLARYGAPRWFLNQFHCSLKRGLCDEESDALVAMVLTESDPRARETRLVEAEAALTMSNVYIPFGTPLRWSLIRGEIIGFVPNRWAFHPLPPLAEIPR